MFPRLPIPLLAAVLAAASLAIAAITPSHGAVHPPPHPPPSPPPPRARLAGSDHSSAPPPGFPRRIGPGGASARVRLPERRGSPPQGGGPSRRRREAEDRGGDQHGLVR